MSFWSKVDPPRPEPLATPAPSAAPSAAPPAAPPEDRRAAPPAPPPAREEPPAPPPRTDQLRLGRGVRLEGKLTFSGTVRIDATFQGSVITDGVLVVGEEAKVDAEIQCGTVVIDGEVNGNVVARDAVEIHPTGKLRGDVEAPSLVVDRGAVFQGASRRPDRTITQGTGKPAAPAPSAHV